VPSAAGGKPRGRSAYNWGPAGRVPTAAGGVPAAQPWRRSAPRGWSASEYRLSRGEAGGRSAYERGLGAYGPGAVRRSARGLRAECLAGGVPPSAERPRGGWGAECLQAGVCGRSARGCGRSASRGAGCRVVAAPVARLGGGVPASGVCGRSARSCGRSASHCRRDWGAKCLRVGSAGGVCCASSQLRAECLAWAGCRAPPRPGGPGGGVPTGRVCGRSACSCGQSAPRGRSAAGNSPRFEGLGGSACLQVGPVDRVPAAAGGVRASRGRSAQECGVPLSEVPRGGVPASGTRGRGACGCGRSAPSCGRSADCRRALAGLGGGVLQGGSAGGVPAASGGVPPAGGVPRATPAPRGIWGRRARESGLRAECPARAECRGAPSPRLARRGGGVPTSGAAGGVPPAGQSAPRRAECREPRLSRGYGAECPRVGFAGRVPAAARPGRLAGRGAESFPRARAGGGVPTSGVCERTARSCGRSASRGRCAAGCGVAASSGEGVECLQLGVRAECLRGRSAECRRARRGWGAECAQPGWRAECRGRARAQGPRGRRACHFLLAGGRSLQVGCGRSARAAASGVPCAGGVPSAAAPGGRSAYKRGLRAECLPRAECRGRTLAPPEAGGRSARKWGLRTGCLQLRGGVPRAGGVPRGAAATWRGVGGGVPAGASAGGVPAAAGRSASRGRSAAGTDRPARPERLGGGVPTSGFCGRSARGCGRSALCGRSASRRAWRAEGVECLQLEVCGAECPQLAGRAPQRRAECLARAECRGVPSPSPRGARRRSAYKWGLRVECPQLRGAPRGGVPLSAECLRLERAGVGRSATSADCGRSARSCGRSASRGRSPGRCWSVRSGVPAGGVWGRSAHNSRAGGVPRRVGWGRSAHNCRAGGASGTLA
jgi:hypothetical protein